MFFGEYHVNIGEKNRLAIPKKLRENLSDSVIITKGFEKSLLLFDKLSWEKYLLNLNAKNPFNLESLNSKRFFIGGSFEVEYDSQGRFVVPESLKTFADIKEKTVFLGIGDWIEIWDEEKWINKVKNLHINLENIITKIHEQ